MSYIHVIQVNYYLARFATWWGNFFAVHTDVVIDVAQQSRRDRVSSSSPFPRLFVSLFHFRIQEEVNKRDHNGEGAYKNFSDRAYGYIKHNGLLKSLKIDFSKTTKIAVILNDYFINREQPFFFFLSSFHSSLFPFQNHSVAIPLSRSPREEHLCSRGKLLPQAFSTIREKTIRKRVSGQHWSLFTSF